MNELPHPPIKGALLPRVVYIPAMELLLLSIRQVAGKRDGLIHIPLHGANLLAAGRYNGIPPRERKPAFYAGNAFPSQIGNRARKGRSGHAGASLICLKAPLLAGLMTEEKTEKIYTLDDLVKRLDRKKTTLI